MGFTVLPGRFRALIPAAACVASLSVINTTTAVAQESPISVLVSDITQFESDINRINLEIGGLQEAVNQALVDLHDAQSLAEQARRGAQEAKDRLNETQADVERAQEELDGLSRSSYRSTSSTAPSRLGSGDSRKDSLDRQTYLRRESDDKRQALEELQRTRTRAANDESTLRQVSRLADQREQDAIKAESDARETLENSVSELEDKVSARDNAVTDLENAQSELSELRPEHPLIDDTSQPAPTTTDAPTETAPSEDVPTESAAVESVPETTEAAAPSAPSVQPESSDPTESTEPTTESTPEESVETAPAETPAAETPASEAPAPQAAPAVSDLSNPDTIEAAMNAFAEMVNQSQAQHSTFEDPYQTGQQEQIASTSTSDNANSAVAASDAENGTNVQDVLPEVKDNAAVSEEIRGTTPSTDDARQQQIEAVIARAESQIGTPYVWGGGDANGPTAGISDGTHKKTGQLGYDCSGLVLYAFAGAGISLPHYTGYQYQRGEKIPVAQAERGDLLFWGENGSRHVAIYLGDGMMLEAPQTGMNVQKTAVRQSGLAPYAVRLI